MNLLQREARSAQAARFLAALPVIRPLRPGDRRLVELLMRKLSPTSRLRRFHAPINELPQVILDRLVRADVPGEATLLATTRGYGEETAVGEARYAVTNEGDSAREFAIVVSDPWQRMGVGLGLLRELIQQARRSGIGALYGDTFVDNRPMLALARRLGFEILRHPTDARLKRMSIRLGHPEFSAVRTEGDLS